MPKKAPKPEAAKPKKKPASRKPIVKPVVVPTSVPAQQPAPVIIPPPIIASAAIPPVEKKESFLHRHLMAELVAIFLVAATLGVVCYIFSAIPNVAVHKIYHSKTTNWKVYTNSDYEFEFKYPPALNLVEESKKPLAQRARLSDKDQDIMEFFINDPQQFKPLTNSENIVIAGATWSKSSWDQGGSRNYIYQNDFHRNIRVLVPAANLAMAQQVLSTFKFTLGAKDDISCIQVITSAQNPKTGEIKNFPTPCDVPQDWRIRGPAQ